MVAKTAEIMEVKNIVIGSDLCLNQPDSVVEWMRNGTWSKSKNYGEGSKKKHGFPKHEKMDARETFWREKMLNTKTRQFDGQLKRPRVLKRA